MRRSIIIILAVIAIGISFLSFGLRNMVGRRSSQLMDKLDSENMKDLLGKARSYYEQKEYDDAIRYYNNYIRRFPESEPARDAILAVADIYKRKNEDIKLREELKRFASLYPADPRIKEVAKEIEELNIKILFSDIITEESFRYEIKPGDTLQKIASRFNTTVGLLKRGNDLKSDIIFPGKYLKVSKIKFFILVDKSKNILELKKRDGETIKTYEVATGENFDTPEGTFKIEEKMISPPWYKVGAIVKPDSPDYELGTRWMGLSIEGYGIHGTNDETSIGKYVTNGCIRMRNSDVETLYDIVPSGTEVTIVK